DVLERQLLRLRQHGRTRRLHGEERAGIDVVLYAAQRGDELRPPRRPAEPPARHAERFRQRVELDRAFPRPGDLEDARRDVAVVRAPRSGAVGSERALLWAG